eukprot:1701278-Alexandrium_andersonii.AAC.1
MEIAHPNVLFVLNFVDKRAAGRSSPRCLLPTTRAWVTSRTTGSPASASLPPTSSSPLARP